MLSRLFECKQDVQKKYFTKLKSQLPFLAIYLHMAARRKENT